MSVPLSGLVKGQCWTPDPYLHQESCRSNAVLNWYGPYCVRLRLYCLSWLCSLVSHDLCLFSGQAINAFDATLEQLPAVVSSPDVVLLKCRFDLTEGQFLSVVWLKGDSEVQIHANTKTVADTSDGYDHIVVGDESQLTLSQDGSGDWSEATLTMHINYCLKDTYHCLVTDSNTQQSQRSLTLTFTGMSCLSVCLGICPCLSLSVHLMINLSVHISVSFISVSASLSLILVIHG